MQINTNKYQTICKKNDSKLRKEKVIAGHMFLRGINAIQKCIQNIVKLLRSSFLQK